MHIIWDCGSATAADVQKALRGDRPLKDSTIRTVLMRLEEKGYARHEVDGRTFVYSCVEPPGTVAARAVKQIVDRLCQGSLESLLAGMVRGAVNHKFPAKRGKSANDSDGMGGSHLGVDSPAPLEPLYAR
jgi:predicted transcriptional regulator